MESDSLHFLSKAVNDLTYQVKTVTHSDAVREERSLVDEF